MLGEMGYAPAVTGAARRRDSMMWTSIRRSTAPCGRGSLVGHRVGDVVEDDAKGEAGELFGVLGAIRPLPCIA